MQISKRKIQVLMAENDLITKTLAEKIGTLANNLSAILCRGTCRPETAAKIAGGLGVPVSEILKEE